MILTKQNTVKKFLKLKSKDHNLMKKTFLKRFLKAKKNEIFLFAFYKKHKDCKIHISIEDEVPIKGTISRTKNFQIVDYVFTDRFSDFSYIDEKNIHRFYIRVKVERAFNFNICFKFELSEPKIVVRNRDLKLPNFEDDKFNPEFHEDITKSLQNLHIFQGLPKYKNINKKSKNSFNIVKFNKRAISAYSLNKRISSAANFRVTERRIISAKQKRSGLNSFRRKHYENKIHLKEIRVMAVKIQRKIEKNLIFQHKWIQVLKIFAVMRAMVDKFAERVEEIENFEVIAQKMENLNDAFKYPKMLLMYFFSFYLLDPRVI